MQKDTQNSLGEVIETVSGRSSVNFTELVDLIPELAKYATDASRHDLVIVGAHAIVTHKGHILVVKENRHSYFNLPGGSFERRDKDLLSCVRRELVEEVGDAMAVESSTHVFSSTSSTISGKTVLYIAALFQGTLVHTNFKFPTTFANPNRSGQRIHPMVYRSWLRWLLKEVIDYDHPDYSSDTFNGPLEFQEPNLSEFKAILFPIREPSLKTEKSVVFKEDKGKGKAEYVVKPKKPAKPAHMKKTTPAPDALVTAVSTRISKALSAIDKNESPDVIRSLLVSTDVQQIIEPDLAAIKDVHGISEE